ncbi:MAG TPA: hypothetical protein VGR69_02680 [Candidatus Rubrimentiphilum sp.]|nr:hypothetical protein [Candidatus Rubrimentiphilum sp.]
MSDKQKPKNRDDAVRNADDTGMLNQQEEINEEEIILGEEEGKSLEDDLSE